MSGTRGKFHRKGHDMCLEVEESTSGPSTPKVDDAVGVLKCEENQIKDERKWFVAIVNNRSEKKTAQSVQKMGYVTFVPIQREKHEWKDGRKKEVDRILIPAVVFVRCTEEERKKVVNHPSIKRFMVDQTRKKSDGRHPIAVIPDWQMNSFQILLSKAQEALNIEPIPINVGDKVKVISGDFSGVIGKVIEQPDGDTYLIILIELLGCAKLKIDRNILAAI